MYIVFDKSNKEQLRYYLDELPESLQKYKYVELESEEDIPVKEGFRERAVLVDGELTWEYEKIEPSKEEQTEEDIATLKSTSNVNLMALMEINTRLRDLEREVKKND